jgi:hypothetical protein
MVVSMHNHDYGDKLIREVTGLSKTHTSGEIALLHSFTSESHDKLCGVFFFGEGVELL